MTGLTHQRDSHRRPCSLPIVERLEERQFLSASVAKPPALHLLFIGASYTNGYQPGKGDVQPLPTLISQLAVAAGFAAPVITNLSLDGKTLEYALAHFNAKKVPTNIDYVIFQDQSEVMSNGKGVADTAGSEKAITSLYSKVKAVAKNAKPIIFEDWGRSAKDTSELKKWYPTVVSSKGYAAAATQMQADIKKNVAAEATFLDKTAGKNAAIIANVGDAFTKDGLNQELFASDNHHATNEGYMLSGLVFFDTIYKAKSAKYNFASVFSKHSITAAVGKKVEGLADAVA